MGLLMPTRTDIKLGQDVTTLPPQTQAALNRAQAAGKNVQQSLADAVAKITASLNKTKADNRGGVAGPATKTESSAPDYHAIVPINDYPQKARWKATNKEQMVALQDLSGASITNKGEYRRAASGIRTDVHWQVSSTRRAWSPESDKNQSFTFSSRATKNSVSSWLSTNFDGSCWKHRSPPCRVQIESRQSLGVTRYKLAMELYVPGICRCH